MVGRFSAAHQRLVLSARSALRRRLPTANELAYDYGTSVVIAYSPTLNGIDGLVSLAIRADHVDLHFNPGPKLRDPRKLLQGSGKMTRFFRLESAGQLRLPDIESFIRQAIALSRVPLPPRGKGSLVVKTGNTVKRGSRPTRARRRARRTSGSR